MTCIYPLAWEFIHSKRIATRFQLMNYAIWLYPRLQQLMFLFLMWILSLRVWPFVSFFILIANLREIFLSLPSFVLRDSMHALIIPLFEMPFKSVPCEHWYECIDEYVHTYHSFIDW